MRCIQSRQTIENSVNKSRFIAEAIPCGTLVAVQAGLKQLALEYSDASHIAFAYRLKTDSGVIYRFYDAGEPTGTAGKPILQHVEGKGLVNLLVAVIRYYGGIKLGAGGLTRAYGNAARDVLEAAEIYPFIERVNVHLTLDYPKLQPLEYQLKKLDGVIVKQEFAGQVKLVVQLPQANADALLQAFGGSVL